VNLFIFPDFSQFVTPVNFMQACVLLRRNIFMFPSTSWAVGDQINDYTAEYAQIN
jgi:hypothetical protein